MKTWKDRLGTFPIAALLAALGGSASAEGNVLAFVDVNGDLHVIGDDLANTVYVTHYMDHPDGEYSVSGPAPGSDETTVNGQGFVMLNAPGRVIVDLGDGNDHLALSNGGASFPATVATGGGADLVEVSDLSLLDMSIATGPGDDRLVLGVQGGGELFVHMGAGDDQLSSMGFNGDLEVTTGDGDDRLEFLRFDTGKLDIATGAGADSLLVTGDRFGPPPPGTFFITHFTVDLGPDDDRLQVGKTSIVFPTMDGGSGRDAFLEPGGVHYFTTPDIRSFEIARTTSRDDLAITKTVLGRIVLEDGTPVPGASVALPELGLLTTTRPDGSFAFEVVNEGVPLDVTAAATLLGRRVTGAALVVPTEELLSLVGDVVLSRQRENVLVFGSPGKAAALAANLEALGLRPEQVTLLPSLAPDLSHYAVVWHVGRPPRSQEEWRLVQFVRGGGGLHLTGDGQFVDPLESLLDELLVEQDVEVQTTSNGAYAFAPAAVGRVALVPNVLTQFDSLGPTRNLVGVGEQNVLVARSNGRIFGGAWGSSNLVGGRGRLTVVMSQAWIKRGESLDVLENLLTFLERQPKVQPVR